MVGVPAPSHVRSVPRDDPPGWTVDGERPAVRQHPLRRGMPEVHSDDDHRARPVGLRPPAARRPPGRRGSGVARRPTELVVRRTARRRRWRGPERRRRPRTARAGHAPPGGAASGTPPWPRVAPPRSPRAAHSPGTRAFGSTHRPTASVQPRISMLPPHVGPVTTRSAWCQLHGGAGCRVDGSLRARGESQSTSSSENVSARRDDQLASEQRGPQRGEMVGVDRRPGAEMDLGRAAVEAGDSVEPEPVQQVGVVAVSEEPLRVLPHDVRVQVAEHRDLVFAADGRQDRAHGRVGEGGEEVPGALRGARGPAGGGHTQTGSTPTTSRSRWRACSWIAGYRSGAAHDGDTTATRAPGAIGGGTARSCGIPESVSDGPRATVSP